MKQTAYLMSSVYQDEGWDTYLKKLPDVEFLDFRNLEGTCCYCSNEAADEIWDKIQDVNPEGLLQWIDTGDYHYLSALSYQGLEDPGNLILIDNHSDNFEYEDTLSCGNWMSYLDKLDLYDNIRGQKAYISLDLDILSPEYFRTNWDQGTMTLDELFSLIRTIAVTSGISAIDVCGGITRSKGATDSDLALNFQTRKKILAFLQKLL